MPPSKPREPRESPHECEIRVPGEFGPGTTFSCDACGKKWVYRPTDLLSGKIATWPFGGLIRFTLILAIVGINLLSDGRGWRKVREIMFTSIVNWFMLTILIVLAALDYASL